MATTQQTPPGTGPDLRKGDIDAAAKENMREGSLAPKVFIPAAVIMAAFIGITLAFPIAPKKSSTPCRPTSLTTSAGTTSPSLLSSLSLPSTWASPAWATSS